MINRELIINIVLEFHPAVQAIYLFGSSVKNEDIAKSDIDIALLLPHEEAKSASSFFMSDLEFKLKQLLKKKIDLVNFRVVSTVFQKEIVFKGERIYTGDKYAADETEMLTLSYYQKLNEERKDILDEFYKSKRAVVV